MRVYYTGNIGKAAITDFQVRLFLLKIDRNRWFGGKCLSISFKNDFAISHRTVLLKGGLNQIIFRGRFVRILLGLWSSKLTLLFANPLLSKAFS